MLTPIYQRSQSPFVVVVVGFDKGAAEFPLVPLATASKALEQTFTPEKVISDIVIVAAAPPVP